MCRTKKKKLYNVGQSYDSDHVESVQFKMDAILKKNIHVLQTDKWRIKLQGNETLINFKIDTGADVNVIPVKIYNTIKPKPKLAKTSITLTAYNRTKNR